MLSVLSKQRKRHGITIHPIDAEGEYVGAEMRAAKLKREKATGERSISFSYMPVDPLLVERLFRVEDALAVNIRNRVMLANIKRIADKEHGTLVVITGAVHAACFEESLKYEYDVRLIRQMPDDALQENDGYALLLSEHPADWDRAAKLLNKADQAIALRKEHKGRLSPEKGAWHIAGLMRGSKNKEPAESFKYGANEESQEHHRQKSRNASAKV
jgi:hypothetical protein